MGRKPKSPEQKAAEKAAKAAKKAEKPEVEVTVGESPMGVMTFPEGQHPRTLRKIREEQA